MTLGKNPTKNPFDIPVAIVQFGLAQVETNSSFYHANDDWNDLTNVILLHESSQDEVPLVSLPSSHKTFIATVIVLSLLIGSYFKCIIYSFVFTTNKKSHGWMHRPINVLTVSSTIIHHVTHVSIGIWYILLMMIETPLGQSMGFHFCQIMDVVGLYGLVYLSVGSLGIAVYRVLYIKQEYLVKYVIGEKTLLFVILSMSITACGMIVCLFKLESSSYRFQINICSGSTVTFSQTLIEYGASRGEQMLATTYLQTTSIYVCIAFQTIEFGIYMWFFYTIYKHDNGNMRKLLTHDAIRERNLKNVGTFLGHFYGFVVEYVFLISILVLTHFADAETHHFKAFANIVKLVDFGLLSAVEVLSSPGLKNFMK